MPLAVRSPHLRILRVMLLRTLPFFRSLGALPATREWPRRSPSATRTWGGCGTPRRRCGPARRGGADGPPRGSAGARGIGAWGGASHIPVEQGAASRSGRGEDLLGGVVRVVRFSEHTERQVEDVVLYGAHHSFERLLVTCLGRSDELFQRGVVHVRVPFRIDFIRQDEPRDL